MTKHPSHNATPLPALTLALALGALSGHVFAGPGTQTEDDIYVGKKRTVQGVTAPSTGTPKPPAGAGTSPNTARSTAPQGSAAVLKNSVQGVNTPGTTTLAPRSGAGVSPNTAAAAKKNALTGGDDDLDDLEVERRKVQGVNMPGTTAPLLRPGAGTSPNTGRSAALGPGPLPGK